MTAPDSPPGAIVIGNYEVSRVLGGGDMSTVYLARRPTLSRWAALKVLAADSARHPAMRSRFLDEGDTTARLQHPNVVTVYDRGETTDGRPWIAMRFVAGGDAEAALQDGVMTPQRALRIVDEISQALDHAHHRGIVHQDVKPSNILLGDAGQEADRVVLSDFGAAVAAGGNAPDNALVASLAYAAPEVITGGPIDGRADVYSLGCTMFRLLTRRYPFPGDGSIPATITAHLEQPPPRPSQFLTWAGPALDDVIATAMAKDPAQRYRTAGELAAAAAAAARTRRPIHTRRLPPDRSARPTQRPSDAPPPIVPRPAPPRTPRRRLYAAGAGALIVVAAAVTWSLHSTPTPTPNPAPAAPLAAQDSLARLTRLLPPGYPAGSCSPISPTDLLATAAVSCGQNLDPGGPSTATYTLTNSSRTLQSALDDVAVDATVVVCPGNVQSPGPWQRVDVPEVTQGTLLCGVDNGRPLIAWTDDSRRLVASAQSPEPGDSGLDGLYAWWGTHS